MMYLVREFLIGVSLEHLFRQPDRCEFTQNSKNMLVSRVGLSTLHVHRITSWHSVAMQQNASLLDAFRSWQQELSDKPSTGAPGLSRGGAVGGPGRRAGARGMRFDTPHQRGRMIRWNARPDTPRQLLFKDLAFPLSTLLLVASGVQRCAPSTLAPSQRVFSVGLASLMLSMGLSLTPGDIRRALLSPRFALRWWCCKCAARLLCFMVWLRFVWLSAIGAAASVLPRGDLLVRKPSAQDGDMTAPRD
jgi:hypothetical protein